MSKENSKLIDKIKIKFWLLYNIIFDIYILLNKNINNENKLGFLSILLKKKRNNNSKRINNNFEQS